MEQHRRIVDPVGYVRCSSVSTCAFARDRLVPSCDTVKINGFANFRKLKIVSAQSTSISSALHRFVHIRYKLDCSSDFSVVIGVATRKNSYVVRANHEL